MQRRGILWSIPFLVTLGVAVLGTTALRLHTTHTAATRKPAVLGAHTEQVASDQAPLVVAPPVKTNDSQPAILAKEAYLLDVASSYPLYAKNENEQVPIASVTKLMTAVIARKNYKLTDVATTSKSAATIEGSKIDLRTGETMDVQSLLTGLLIQSGNDAAMALAEHMGLEAFVAAMNEEATYLGMKDTIYKDPAGLSDDAHSTAHDLGILASYVIRDDVIRSIVQTQQTSVTSADGSTKHVLQTSNRLIKPDHPLYVPEATGLKTGFTPDAGHCLVASASKNGRAIVTVILHTDSTSTEASAQEARKLLTWGLSTYSWDQTDHN